MKSSLILVGVAALFLSACGGGGNDENIDTGASVSATEGKASATGDSLGRVLAAGSVTRAKEAELVQAFGDRAQRVQAPSGGEEALAEDIGLVLLRQMAHELPADTPVFVTAEDLPRAHQLVARLKAAGLTRVVLVIG